MLRDDFALTKRHLGLILLVLGGLATLGLLSIDPLAALLHRLGSDHWDKVKRKAAQKAHDVAAELLDIYTRRAARQGVAFPDPGADYAALANAFEFEETCPTEYRLDQASGALKFFRKMDEPAKRVAQVETVVGLLTG